jgi:fructose-1,6-bisphosphatase II
MDELGNHTVRLPRNLGLDLLRGTEMAALAAGRWMGLNRPDAADSAANAAMADALNLVNMCGRIVVGEQGKLHDHASLAGGAAIGAGCGPEVDVVLDAIDGRNLLAQGYAGALSVVAVSPRGTMWDPAPAVYMEKIVVGPAVAKALVPECLDAPAAWTLALVARVLDKRVGDLVAFVLNRPRHVDLIAEIRAAGARVMLSPDGDVVGALLAITPDSGVDILMGTGGVTEGLLAAAAVRAVGGGMLGRLDPQSVEERRVLSEAGLDTREVRECAGLVRSRSVFFVATGITDGPLLQGIRYNRERATSCSLLVRGESRTRRLITAEHLLDHD